MRETVPSLRLLTHTAPSPTANPSGLCPTGIASRRLPSRLMTPTLFAGSQRKLERDERLSSTADTAPTVANAVRAEATRIQPVRPRWRRWLAARIDVVTASDLAPEAADTFVCTTGTAGGCQVKSSSCARMA